MRSVSTASCVLPDWDACSFGKALEGSVRQSFGALGNIPYCLIQRYNRPKLVKILKSLKEKDRKEKREESNEESTYLKLQYRTGP